ncbi:MAG: shikimate kinase [Pseudomonadales bacterium]
MSNTLNEVDPISASEPSSREGLNFQRINIVGTSGSGKSTAGKWIAKKLGYPYVELDEIYWKPNWTESTEEELFSNLERSLEGEFWVLDGNYSRTVPIKWRRVQWVVWLDFPYWLTLYQVISRTIRRSVTKEALWAGNRESLRKALFSRDSIIWWCLTSLSKNRRQYLAAMSDARYRHIRFVRIRSRKALVAFIESLPE